MREVLGSQDGASESGSGSVVLAAADRLFPVDHDEANQVGSHAGV